MWRESNKIKYFSQQCKPNVNETVLPHLEMLSERGIRTVEITINDIKMILNSLNPAKACGPDNITVRMLLLCCESIITPIRRIFHNSLRSGIYPYTRKEDNATPVH